MAQIRKSMDCSPPGSSVHGILQARILEWVAISISRESSWPRDRTRVSCIAGRFFTKPSLSRHANVGSASPSSQFYRGHKLSKPSPLEAIWILRLLTEMRGILPVVMVWVDHPSTPGSCLLGALAVNPILSFCVAHN